ncbi:MAG: hypothetical protein GY757_11475 [bacterium]|nr:hypothetical protein [bacterium]
MKKRFNDTGVCIPHKHFMADFSWKIIQTFQMVEQGDYFAITKPRQYGKTTTLYLLTSTFSPGNSFTILPVTLSW